MKRASWWLPAGVFVVVLGVQLALVAGAGTDIPFQDQWDVEGRQLYPAWRDGTWRAADLLRPHNEHRIVWTKLLDLALFSANGQWDPLVQLAVGAGLRAALAAALTAFLVGGLGAGAGAAVAAGVGLAFLPHLAWHNALWGFQSQVYFSLLFSVAALALLGSPAPATPRSWRRQLTGFAAGGAALLAMGAGAMVPIALLGLAGLRAIERRRWESSQWREVGPALVLLVAALALRADVPEHTALHVATAGEFFNAFARALAWPHSGQPLAALGLCLPLAIVVGARLASRRVAAAGEDFVLLLGGWAVAVAVAIAWTRGGGREFDGGVPSRYVDFVVLLPMANAWCAVRLAREAAGQWRSGVRLVAAAWSVFLILGWVGLSAETMRRLILPRLRDRDAPVRLAVAFQRSGDVAVFAGQPALLVPHPNAEVVRAVLADPRLRGVLPPSFQPERPIGPLSRAVRTVLGRQ